MQKNTRAPPCPATPLGSRYHIEHYRKTRFWALYEGNDLLAVTVYKRGAQAVLGRLQTLEQQLAAQQALPALPAQAGEAAVPSDTGVLPMPAAVPLPDFQERLSRPVEQLVLFSFPARGNGCHRGRSKGRGAEYV